MREYNIQRELVHPRIVRLLDLFEIDAMSFATVLEVAPGGDLASHLQLHPVRAVGFRVQAPGYWLQGSGPWHHIYSRP